MRRSAYFDSSAPPKLLERLSRPEEMLRLYEEGRPLGSGRGTARLIELDGKKYILKKEARGGMTAKFLPDSFFSLERFDGEWLIQEFACSQGLSFPLVGRWFIRKHLILYDIYTLAPFVEGCVSLTELIRSEKLTGNELRLAGKAVAAMHKKGIFHGDLNCGNILIRGGEAKVIDFKGSYIFSAPLPVALSQKNILRLLRSCFKESARAGISAGLPFSEHILDGYSEERSEPWVAGFSKRAGVSFLRRIAYRFKF